jgi:hypothetical protein
MVLFGAGSVLLAGAPSYADSNFVEPDPSGGIPGWFVGMIVLVLILGLGTTIWRVTMAQKIARSSGMDPGVATQMTLLSDDGLDATYLAANLRGAPGTPPETTPASSQAAPGPSGGTADRLEELKSLLDRGLVTQAEYDERRKAIIDSV